MIGIGAAMLGGAALGGIGSIYGAEKAASGQRDTNRQNLKIAREQMDFQEAQANTARDYQERMSNTAYQRSMDDMEKAGLNPILAYSQGGASTPQSPSMQGARAQMQNPDVAYAGLGSRIVDATSTASQVKTQEAQQSNLYWKGREAASKVGLNQIQSDQVGEQIEKIGAEISKVKSETKGIDADNVQRQIMADFYSSAEFVKIAKSIGVPQNLLKTIFKGVFGRGK